MITATVYGRAGKDGELRESAAGKPWCRLGIVTDVGKDREGQPVDAWVTIVAFGRQAEALAEVAKGGMVAAMGRLELSRWTASDGTEREQWQLVADEVYTVAAPKRRRDTAPKTSTSASMRVQAPEPEFDDALTF
jgi:single-stranded DNA-binding protein